jgi:UDPglucose 6-dehydrogenase
MKVGIIGCGVVGSAVAESYYNTKCEVSIYDPAKGYEHDIFDSDAIFVCVPSPTLANGSCDSSMLESTLDMLKDYPNVIISKVTATPDIYTRLQKQYPNLVHAPEFLTQANSARDYRNGQLLVLGGNPEHCGQAEQVIKRSITPSRVVKTDIASASLFKYIVNSYLALKVIAMNQYHGLAQAIGIDWNTLASMLALDSRIGASHLQVPGPDGEFGYGGMCFPKDVSALLELARQQTVNMDLLTSVVNINNMLRE